jgi:ATP-dependent Clp protease ATP-binding subunit ClpB
LKKNPKAVVLLDEIEKAHPNVLTVFLQVFDDGRITDPKVSRLTDVFHFYWLTGFLQKGVIYCKDALFIMTSNLASEEIREASPGLRALVDQTENRHQQYLQVIGKFNREIHPVLKRALKRDEFLGRINQIIVFLPLDESEVHGHEMLLTDEI